MRSKHHKITLEKIQQPLFASFSIFIKHEVGRNKKWMRQEYYIVVACDYFVFIKRIHFFQLTLFMYLNVIFSLSLFFFDCISSMYTVYI